MRATGATHLSQPVMGAADEINSFILLPSRQRMSGDDMDTSMAHETSEPLLGDMSQDREIDMEDQSTFKKFAAKAPWKKSRRRRPSVSGKGFDVESMVCTPRKGWRRCMNITAGLLVALYVFVDGSKPGIL